MALDRDSKAVKFIEPNLVDRPGLAVRQDDSFADKLGKSLVKLGEDGGRSCFGCGHGAARSRKRPAVRTQTRATRGGGAARACLGAEIAGAAQVACVAAWNFGKDGFDLSCKHIIVKRLFHLNRVAASPTHLPTHFMRWRK